MQAELRIVALFATFPAYGTEAILEQTDRRGMEAALRPLALRGAEGGKDRPVAEFA